MSVTPSRFGRILLKLSGEGLARRNGNGLDAEQGQFVARQVQRVAQRGVQVAVVVGGGNLLRGSQFLAAGHQVHRATADYMGMLATVINGLALHDTLEGLDCPVRLMTAIRMDVVAERYIRRRAIRHLEKGRVVILAGGTGSPYFTTDTTAALRAIELGADVLLKATKVDGVYSADPLQDPGARRFDRLSYQEVIDRRLRVMDMTAISLCMENHLPIVVFNLHQEGNIERAVAGEPVGTYVGDSDDAQR